MPDNPLSDPRISDKIPRSWAEQLQVHVGGHALWHAAPATEGGGSVGDCGYIDGGRFIKLFNIFDPHNVVGINPSSYELTRTDIHHVTKENLVPLSYNSHIRTIKLGMNLLTGPLQLPPPINATLSADAGTHSETITFLAFCGPTTTSSRYDKTELLARYLTAEHDQILGHFRAEYPVNTNNLFIIQGTKTAASWLGGLASGSCVSLQAEASVSGIGASAGFYSIEDSGWSVTHGDRSWDSQHGADTEPCIVIRPIKVRSRMERVADRLSSVVRSQGTKAQPKTPGDCGQMGSGGASTNSLTPSLSPVPNEGPPSIADSSPVDVSNDNWDVPLLDDQVDMLDELLDFVLDCSPTVKRAVGGWAAVDAFTELHGAFPENWRSNNVITAVVETCGEPQDAIVLVVHVQPWSGQPIEWSTEPVVNGPRVPHKHSHLVPPVVGHAAAASAQWWWKTSWPLANVLRLYSRDISLPAGPPPVLNLAAHTNRANIAGVPADHSPERARSQSHTPSAQRARVHADLVETERAYVAGLELVYAHFLSPLLAALRTPTPILPRSELPNIFANFVAIWNLHRSFLPALEASTGKGQLGDVLLAHFPSLSLYFLFVNAFGKTLARLEWHKASGDAFATWLTAREADTACKSLGLRDWLLSIILQCPRYLFLMKDLLAATEQHDPEYAQLLRAKTLVSEINDSLNISLLTQSRIFSLLALQRACSSLPCPLVAPGRMLLRHGPLVHIERGRDTRVREFLLFSDCLIWLEFDAQQPTSSTPDDDGRTRSDHAPEPPKLGPRALRPPPRGAFNPDVMDAPDGRWTYTASAELGTIEAVVPVCDGKEEEGAEGGARFKVLGRKGSFECIAATEAARDEWVSVLRAAKTHLLSRGVFGTLAASPSTKQDPGPDAAGQEEGIHEKDEDEERGKAAGACDQGYDAVFQPRVPGDSTDAIVQSPSSDATMSMLALSLTTVDEVNEVTAQGHGQEPSTTSADSLFRRPASYGTGDAGGGAPEASERTTEIHTDSEQAMVPPR